MREHRACGRHFGAVAVVLIVDDQEGMRALIRTLFELERPTDTIIEASNPKEALAAYDEHLPDVVILDQMLGTTLGLEDVAEPLLREHPGVHIIVFTAFLDRRLRNRAVGLGVRVCVTQDELRRLPLEVGKLTD
jgi:two-component system response regulator DesR